MKIFLDSANLSDISEFKDYGLVDGVTTNPSLVAKSGKSYSELISEICKIIPGPVSAEVIATEYTQMVEEGLKLAAIAENVVVKLPLTNDGLLACKILTFDYNIKVNVTLCFSAGQAILAAKVGAYFISPFVGRLDDISTDGLNLIQDIREIYNNYTNLNTQILVASIRSPMHVIESAKIGADIVTVPIKILKQLLHHPLTDSGLDSFLHDWHKSGSFL